MNPRLRRLQSDYDLMREAFSGHSHVSIEPIGNRLPPESYRVEFRLRGLYLNGEQPDYLDLHEAEIMLPRHYPSEKPYVVPLTPIFHPNVQEFFCIADYWAAGTTLPDVVTKLADMIQWRVYNPASPLNAIAARWAEEQEPTGLFPIGNVDLGVPDFNVEVLTANAPQLSSVDATNPLPDILLRAADETPKVAATEESQLVVLRRPRAPSRDAWLSDDRRIEDWAR